MRATLSILGLYKHDPQIMQGLQVPAGMDRDALISYIMMDCAELELVYPSWEIMHNLIALWAQARLHSWERLFNSTVQSYNPIHNYDRFEDWTDNRHSTGTQQRTSTAASEGTSAGSSSGTNRETATGEGLTETSKAAYNSNEGLYKTEAVEQTTKNTTSGSDSRQSTDTTRGTVTGTDAGSNSETGQDTHAGHIYGNIGVTTAAQMLTGERELYRWDVYQAITDEFKQRFCVLVY